jgi:hypothetical protein
MGTPGDSTGDGPIGDHDDALSGSDINESIAKAEAGSQVREVHTASDPGQDEAERIEEIEDVAGATEGRRDGQPGASTVAEPGPSPRDIGSGGAQRVEGARISDRVAAGQPVPEAPPFDIDEGGEST